MSTFFPDPSRFATAKPLDRAPEGHRIIGGLSTSFAANATAWTSIAVIDAHTNEQIVMERLAASYATRRRVIETVCRTYGLRALWFGIFGI